VPESVTVELDIFSGRPNPRWRLSQEDADLLMATVADLPEATPVLPVGHLGYRGLAVELDGTRLLVQQGTVLITRGDTTTYRADPDRAVERWLLDTGRPALDPEIVALVDRELPG